MLPHLARVAFGLEPVAAAADGGDVGVMQQPDMDGGGDHRVTEDTTPHCDGKIAGATALRRTQGDGLRAARTGVPRWLRTARDPYGQRGSYPRTAPVRLSTTNTTGPSIKCPFWRVDVEHCAPLVGVLVV